MKAIITGIIQRNPPELRDPLFVVAGAYTAILLLEIARPYLGVSQFLIAKTSFALLTMILGLSAAVWFTKSRAAAAALMLLVADNFRVLSNMAAYLYSGNDPNMGQLAGSHELAVTRTSILTLTTLSTGALAASILTFKSTCELAVLRKPN